MRRGLQRTKKVALFVAGLGLLLALASPDAQAFTTTFGANVAQPSDVTTAAAGRVGTAVGGCRRNYGPGWACIWRYGRRYCR